MKYKIPNIFQLFLIFLKLGLTSFGGPIAHLGYFHNEFVSKRKWITDQAYTDLVALCQFLPGPASSQVGLAIGYFRAGYIGSLVAWIGFTLPSAIILTLFALSITDYHNIISPGVIHGLKIVAVAIVAQAIYSMASKICINKQSIAVMLISCCCLLLFPYSWLQIVIIISAGVFGCLVFKKNVKDKNADTSLPISISRTSGIFWLTIFSFLLIFLILVSSVTSNEFVKLFNIFYQTGSLVFGGGHVVLPLLDMKLVPEFISKTDFLSGYGAAQAIPGPLFAFSSYLGAIIENQSSPWLGSVVCLFAIFLPSFLLLMGVLPFWKTCRENKNVQAALFGVNASVVGLLLAAFYNPIWISAIYNAKDFSLALVSFCLLQYFKFPPWIIVILCGTFGYLIY